jgi:hypothetical protein
MTKRAEDSKHTKHQQNKHEGVKQAIETNHGNMGQMRKMERQMRVLTTHRCGKSKETKEDERGTKTYGRHRQEHNNDIMTERSIKKPNFGGAQVTETKHT